MSMWFAENLGVSNEKRCKNSMVQNNMVQNSMVKNERIIKAIAMAYHML